MEDRPIEIARILHGSHLFGTATGTSDEDWKSVVVPTARDVLLGNVGASACAGEARDEGRRSGSGDVDLENHDALRFTHLLAQGQPVALEMLFAPDRFHAFSPHEAFRRLQGSTGRIVSKEAARFVGYCRRQANLHGLKGERAAAADRALEALAEAARRHGGSARVSACMEEVVAVVGSEHVAVEGKEMADGRVIPHLAVCGRLTPGTAALDVAIRTVRSVSRQYGHRTRSAALFDGKDWKALMHAVRIGREAVELLATGRITLPRPEAAWLTRIKLGQVPPGEVEEEIVSLLDAVESAAEASDLPACVDRAFLEDWVVDLHASQVAREGLLPPAP